MGSANLRPRLWVPLVGLCLALVAPGASATQTSKYDSIPATAPASRFTDNGDGTVTDKTTGRQSRSPDGAQRNPGEVLQTCKELAGSSGDLDSAALHPGYHLDLPTGKARACPGLLLAAMDGGHARNAEAVLGEHPGYVPHPWGPSPRPQRG